MTVVSTSGDPNERCPACGAIYYAAWGHTCTGQKQNVYTVIHSIPSLSNNYTVQTMRKAQSFPCPFCAVTSETRKTAQKHLLKHRKALAKLAAPKKVVKQ